MKTELKHIAPYLPYELPIEIRGDRNILTIRNLHHWGEENIKPILRPLSDLTKEIEHNGEKFVPIEKLQSIFTKRLRFDEDGFYCHISESLVRGKKHDTYFNFNQLEAYSYLFEWHFDVFGLIENNLAIDINTLK